MFLLSKKHLTYVFSFILGWLMCFNLNIIPDTVPLLDLGNGRDEPTIVFDKSSSSLGADDINVDTEQSRDTVKTQAESGSIQPTARQPEDGNATVPALVLDANIMARSKFINNYKSLQTSALKESLDKDYDHEEQLANDKDRGATGNTKQAVISAASSDNASSVTSKVAAPYSGPSIGLTVVHCKEELKWVKDAPKHWNVKVYETCGQQVSAFSQTFKNAGSEECTAYFETMIAQYEDLPEINIFLQSDALVGSQRAGRPFFLNHTPFKTLEELGNAVLQSDAKFLAFGTRGMFIKHINRNNNYVEWRVRDLFDIFSLPYAPENAQEKEQTKTLTRPGASFAVHKDRIRANTIEAYRTIQKNIFDSDGGGARRWCCALENTWHAVLGEPYILPETSTVDHIWKKEYDLSS